MLKGITRTLYWKMSRLCPKNPRSGWWAALLATVYQRAKFYAKQRQGIVLTIDHIGLFGRRIGATGWALSRKGSTGVQQIAVYLDEHLLGNAVYGHARADVARTYPFIANSGRSGFHFYSDIPEYITFTPGVSLLRFEVTGERGRCYQLHCQLRDEYYEWILRNEPDAAALELQRQTRFAYQPRISLITPTYNTPETFLIEMIQSVLAQTYSNWELCLADGASHAPYIKELLARYARQDARIKVIFLPENLGIAGNSNAAITLASGEWIGLLDHDDVLAPFALIEIVKYLNQRPDTEYLYSDEDRLSEDGAMRHAPQFKPDWSPDTLRSTNYPTHFSVFKRALLERVGGFRPGFDGSQDYDLILRATEQAREIGHIPKVLYHWRMHENSLARDALSKTYTYNAAQKALQDHLLRIGMSGIVENAGILGFYKITYTLKISPLVSIIIPNQDHASDLKRCLHSILKKSSYRNFEILLVENGSKKPETFAIYDQFTSEANVHLLEWQHPFNYAAVNNFAAQQAAGEVLLFLNNDTQVITPDWLERMLEHAIRPEIGAVGAKLYYPDGTIQHAGVILGIHGSAAHGHQGFPANAPGYMGRLNIVHNVSAVTGACLMLRREIFQEIGGFDERYPFAFNDIDLCLKIRQKNYLVIYTPYAELYHDESMSRGYDDHLEKYHRFKQDTRLFQEQWQHILDRGDPYYNPNLTLDREDFSIKSA
ncbi:glycosyl transferase family 2 [Candidatus Vecturithrix granuli]|uniref:Glycosyl transferase family 2 n=1 Tax=Vecturithrix granuli TaxID=1499967 RepID=A0A081BW88_VECG1|nr:glycosyl transferase family 2 [Candidatus Vecturithrix granuli]